jgi:hypothetical protein
MKMVKSLLLGSAAGLAAVTAGQAADLPVKAKPVEYVKICSLYGAGFYYMPGTDLCIKVGGWIRFEAMDGNTGGSFTWGPFAGVANNRTTNNLDFRARGYLTADVRNQTEYGTIRGYISVGLSSNDTGLTGGANAPPTEFSSNRAFVQFAGLTAGLSQSFYDFYATPAMQFRGGFTPASDTGDPGWITAAYTAQLGGGFSATIAAEERRTEQVIDASGLNTGTGNGSLTPGAGFNIPVGVGGGVAATGIPGNLTPGNGAYGGFQAPDIVGNLRVDQAWGGVQLMGALHELNPLYYSTGLGVVPGAGSGANTAHPSDQWGWAAGAGLKLNLPMITQGDWFQAQVNVTQGALGYAFFSQKSDWGMTNGAQEAFGVLSDCVYGGTLAVAASQTGCQKTSAWGFNAGFEHYWTPSVHESFYGDYYQVNYGTSANAMLCAFAGGGNGLQNGTGGTAATATPGCNNNWSTFGVGSRLQWDVTKSFYLGVEVLYESMKSATLGTGAGLGSYGPVGGSIAAQSSASAWIVSVRAHRDFLP